MDDANLGVFGNYFILRQEAAGELAEIFLARSSNPLSNGKLIQLKKLKASSSQDLEISKVFIDEGHKALGLNHSNIVQTLELGKHDQNYFLAMEYPEGKNLDHYAQKIRIVEDLMPVEIAIYIASQVAAGLHFGHQFKNQLTGETNQLIHGSLSPSAILLSYTGEVKLTYFGINPFTLSYHSPEQIRKETLQPASDQFSLAAILWELLTGLKLFHQGGSNQAQIKEAILKSDESITPPSQFRSEVPTALDEIILKALRAEPSARYPSAEIFSMALSTLLHKEFPSFHPSRLRESLLKVFEEEMPEERSQISELNFNAQEKLEGHDGKTRLIRTEVTKEIKTQSLDLSPSAETASGEALTRDGDAPKIATTPLEPPVSHEFYEHEEIEEHYPVPDPIIEDFSYPKENFLKRTLLRLNQKQRRTIGLVTAGAMAIVVAQFIRTSGNPPIEAVIPTANPIPKITQLPSATPAMTPATTPPPAALASTPSANASGTKNTRSAMAAVPVQSPEPPMEDLILRDPDLEPVKPPAKKSKKHVPPVRHQLSAKVQTKALAMRAAQAALTAPKKSVVPVKLGKPVPILVHIRITLTKGPPASALLVNNMPLDLRKPYVRVMSDQKVLVQVQRKGLKPLFKPLFFDSREKLLPNYDLDINLR